MRAKLNLYQERNPIANDLLDLEFLVQFLMLQQGDPYFARHTHALNQMRHLFIIGVLSKKQYASLKQAYKTLHQSLHENLLRPSDLRNEDMHAEIMRVYKKFL